MSQIKTEQPDEAQVLQGQIDVLQLEMNQF